MRLCLGAVEHDLTTRSLVMGVLGGAFPGAGDPHLDAVLAEAGAAAAAGADLLDLGGVGEATGPPVGEAEELDRLVPVVEALRARFDVPLSIDTWRPGVLAAAAAAGAAVATDSQGLGGGDYLQAASSAKVTIVLRRAATPAETPRGGIVTQVRALLGARVAQAQDAGIPDERIVVDPGLDLGTSPTQSLALLQGSAALADLGPPLLVDASNKRFLGLLLDLDVGERRMASHAAAALGIARGGRVVRAHDIRGARRVVEVMAALLGARLAQVTRPAVKADHV